MCVLHSVESTLCVLYNVECLSVLYCTVYIGTVYVLDSLEVHCVCIAHCIEALFVCVLHIVERQRVCTLLCREAFCVVLHSLERHCVCTRQSRKAMYEYCTVWSCTVFVYCIV